MRFVVFGAQRRLGALVGEAIVDLNRANPALPSNLAAFIAGAKPVEVPG